MSIQENIKRHLIEKNISAAELERRTGIPHAVVNILHGRSKNPSLKTAQAIAKELGCSVEELLDSKIQSPIQQTTSNHNLKWYPELYKDVFNAVYNGIQELKLQPNPQLVTHWLNEVYAYSIGSPQQNVDMRFVYWIIQKS